MDCWNTSRPCTEIGLSKFVAKFLLLNFDPNLVMIMCYSSSTLHGVTCSFQKSKV